MRIKNQIKKSLVKSSFVLKIILNDKDGLFKVVNKENSIDKSYKPEELIIPKVNFVGLENEPRNRVSNVLKKDLENLFSDAKIWVRLIPFLCL